MNKKGFTLIELISMIIILAVISILSITTLTKTMKNSNVKEIETFKDQIINACGVYVETFINEHFTSSNEEEILLTELMEEKFLTTNITNPTSCDNSNVVVLATKNLSDRTVSYEVYCKSGSSYNELEKASN